MQKNVDDGTHDGPPNISVCDDTHRPVNASHIAVGEPPRAAHLALYVDSRPVFVARDGSGGIPNDAHGKGNDEASFVEIGTAEVVRLDTASAIESQVRQAGIYVVDCRVS